VHTLAQLVFQQLAAGRWPMPAAPWFAGVDPYRAVAPSPMAAWGMPGAPPWNAVGSMPPVPPGMAVPAMPQSFVYWYP
jgi:hypothetical protein